MASGIANADEGEFDHTQNDELQMCGSTRDHEEDNVADDMNELFGRSATDPLPGDQTRSRSRWMVSPILMPTVATVR